jgi:hypothetical protein
MRGFIAIQAVPMDQETYSLECSECGVVGVCTAEDARAECWKHRNIHQAAEAAKRGDTS